MSGSSAGGSGNACFPRWRCWGIDLLWADQTTRGGICGARTDRRHRARVRGPRHRRPIVLIHAGVCADFFAPLVQEPALSGNFTLVRYHRTGYAGSGRLQGAVSLARQAARCRALMRHLGIERAHIVGHSSSASIALQLGLDAPDAGAVPVDFRFGCRLAMSGSAA